MPIEQLLDFAPFEERIDRIDTFIHDSLMANPNLGLKDMRRMLLKKFGATIRQGDIVIGDKSMPVNPSYLDTLKLNDRIAWAKGFNVTTDAERKLLSRLTKVPAPLLPLGPVDANKDIQINALKDILEKQGYQGLVDFLRNNGFSVHKQDDTRVAVNFKTGEIIDLGQCGLKVEKKQKSSRQNKSNASNGLHVGPARLDRGHKRDWEIESGQDEDKKLGV